MKTIKLTLLLMLLPFLGFSQVANTQVESKTYFKEATYKSEGEEKNYRVSITETVRSMVKMRTSELDQKEQTRTNSPEYVTKIVRIDNDADENYDKHAIIRYVREGNDAFEVVFNDSGFGLKVDGRYIEYIMEEGLYQVDNKDRDYFVVEEFEIID